MVLSMGHSVKHDVEALELSTVLEGGKPALLQEDGSLTLATAASGPQRPADTI